MNSFTKYHRKCHQSKRLGSQSAGLPLSMTAGHSWLIDSSETSSSITIPTITPGKRLQTCWLQCLQYGLCGHLRLLYFQYKHIFWRCYSLHLLQRHIKAFSIDNMGTSFASVGDFWLYKWTLFNSSNSAIACLLLKFLFLLFSAIDYNVGQTTPFLNAEYTNKHKLTTANTKFIDRGHLFFHSCLPPCNISFFHI